MKIHIALFTDLFIGGAAKWLGALGTKRTLYHLHYHYH